MVTGHRQSDPRVGRPGRESNPVHLHSQKRADIRSQGDSEERSATPGDGHWYNVCQSEEGDIVRRGLRAPSARQPKGDKS